ncbi:hypothetical protein GQ43DRAFT_482240 [Delitschia confertaspora ATCC 74209]|uniref:JmjC domain-containing protein n=1 Tax=Delitschia confertaspora ATCC 74209 TaxID=1513339 RepID=A0A9P4JK98_9PLEO|nr:hypothetical protein GQ43DRAFT_482240 [Delitschia confertaspora ATCC 74209]
MPAARPRASFEPIPPDFDVRTFVETADNFQYVDRISYEMIANNGIEQFEKLVLLHVIIGGKPLVIDGFEEVLDPWTFTPTWLRDNCGDKVENARNLTTKENIPLTIHHYLKHLGKLTDQFFDVPERYRDKTRQRIYLKDIDCPPVWQDKLKEHIPPCLFYLNENTGEIGGPGATDKGGLRKGRGVARAGDLMSSLPPEMRAENLMCYIGHEGTYTPAHREMSASLGQNIMVNASTTISEDGKPEHPGSSLWFMTETKDRHLVSEYWLSVLGHDIEVENHFAQLIAWKKAPFKTYVVEQRVGDFILIPPMAPHQVWNRGTRTMKIAWNRTTVETLEMALAEALPNSRVVCRDEQYKNKAIVYYTLLKYSNLIRITRSVVERGGERAEAVQRSVKVRQVQRDFKRLFNLYKTILLSEMFAPDSREHPEFLAYDSNVTCAYCRCNIFNRFMTCKACPYALGTDIEEPYDICMDCYAMGRSCACQSGYTWVEQWKWKDLLTKYEEWRAQIIDIDGNVTENTPLPLTEERRYLGRKTLAQVCQEQLRARPFVDIKAPHPKGDEDDDEEIQINEVGTVKKIVKKRSKQWLANHKSCHSCIHRHPKWKTAFCTNCDLAYCYGILFRAHDMMPLTVMENSNWKCPHCEGVCNIGACRKDPRQRPYEPKGTLLGHDTRKVADVRSVECLVDFSVSNLNWIREDEGTGAASGRLQRRRDEAEMEKQNDPALDARFVDENIDDIRRNGIEYSPVEDITIDPSLHGEASFMPTASHQNGFVNHGHEESLHQGYVKPSSVMYGYQPDEGSVDDDYRASYYPDPDIDGEIPRIGDKRTREEDDEDIRWVGKKSKKRKNNKDEAVQPRPPKNAPGKQYRKEVERKLLEDAKKEGRFILIAARMKGKTKVVKLKLNPEQLADFRDPQPPPLRTAPVAKMNGPSATEARSILQSDILPATNGATELEQKPRTLKSFRVRVEDDDDFQARRRDRAANGATPADKLRKRLPRYEEVMLDSDEDLGDEEMGEYVDHQRTDHPKRRDSQWLARKNEGLEDLPTELPADFRDGDVNPRREQNRARGRARQDRRRTMSNAKPQVQIQPAGARPSPNSTGNMSDEDAIHKIDDAGDGSALLLAQSAVAAAEVTRKAEEEEAARREAEKNMKAKRVAADWDGGSENEPLSDFFDAPTAQDLYDGADDNAEDVEESAENPVEEELEQSKQSNQPLPAPEVYMNNPPNPTPGSIFSSRGGRSGRKIKIVSARRINDSTPSASATAIPEPGPSTGKKVTTVAVTASVSAFTPVNADSVQSSKKAGRPSSHREVVRLSESDESGDEIPAKRPSAPEVRVSVGRPSRGGVRGSGRPRRGPRGRSRAS